MKSKSIYLVYSHDYNVGYVGNSCNLRKIFNEHCKDDRPSVKRYCDVLGIRPRDTFDIYEIKQCNTAEASYYEGYIYEVIERHCAQIKLLNKNRPNRSRHEWVKAHAEHVKYVRKTWRDSNKDHLKTYFHNRYIADMAERDECHKNWCKANKAKLNEYNRKWRLANKEKVAASNRKWYMANKSKSKPSPTMQGCK